MEQLAVLSPIQLGPLTLKNRVFQSAHSTNFGANVAGPSERHVAYHSERARGGIGMIITEGIRVYPPTWRPGRMGAFDDSARPAYQALTDAVHAHGTRIFAQLNEPGRHLRLDRAAAVSASEEPWATGGVVPHALTALEIDEFVSAWGSGAGRMQDAGFDGIEVQCSHGHLINQFLSPATNRRTDRFGGRLDNRMRFGRMVLDRVFSSTTAPVGIRVTSDEFQANGLGLPEMIEIISRLVEEYPLAYVNVTQSFYAADYTVSTQAADMTFDVAPFRSNARAIKDAIHGPLVLMVCRIDDILVGEEIVSSGDADMVGMARPQIADPHQILKYQSGAFDTLRHCIHCNQACIGRTEFGLSISCVVNPEAGLEREWGNIPPVNRPGRKVLVVGGGPAGMEAAVTAARRGHDVTLAEQSANLGGAIRYAESLPGRARFGLLTDDLERDLRALPIDVALERRISADDAIGAFDTVVVATGAHPRGPEGLDDVAVASPQDVIAGNARAVPGRAALVFDEDGHWAGAGIAEQLAIDGCEVHWASPSAGFAWNVTLYSRTALQRRIGQLGVRVRPFRVPVRVEGDTVWLRDTINGREEPVDDVSLIVYSGPRRAESQLAADLIERRFDGDIWLIGDAYAPRTALEATYEGRLSGSAIGLADLDYFVRSFQAFRAPLGKTKLGGWNRVAEPASP